MSEAGNELSGTQKPGLAVRAFLIVLPVGLAFMVPISLWIYYQKKHQPAPAASQYAVMLRRDLNAEDFARYVRILSQDIGERSLAKPENLDAAAAFIESTMGYDNMGYAVHRQTFEVQGRAVVNLIAELPGKSKPDEAVLVLAAYDAADASGIAAMMCVAHALTGTEHARTIRFAALVNAGDADASVNGLHQLAQESSRGQRVTTALVPVALPMTSSPPPWAQVPVRAFTPKAIDLTALQELQRLVVEAADGP